MLKIKTKNDVNFEPGVAGYKFISSLRRGRYNLKTTIGDLVDNSKDAGATKVWVDFEGPSENVSKIIIADDGSGMNEEQLRGSYTLGYERVRETTEMGKFGVGGTLSSLGIASEKTTITRNTKGDVSVLSYKMSDIKNNDAWGTTPVQFEDWMMDILDNYLGPNGSGTVIILSNFDLDNFSRRKGNMEKSILSYVSKTYCEFIATGELDIIVNGKVAESRDPLCWWHPDVIKSEDKVMDHCGKSYRIRVVDVRNVPQEYRGSYLKNCGGYVYRSNRLIQSKIDTGNQVWGDRAISRHQMYDWVRWGVYYDSDLDEVMGTSFDKSEIIPSQAVLDSISSVVKPYGVICHNEKLKKDSEVTKDEQERRDGLANNLANSISSKKDVFEVVKKDKGTEIKQNLKIVDSNISIPNYIIKVNSLGTMNEIGQWAINENKEESKFILQINRDHRYIQKYYLSKSSEVQDAAISWILPYCISMREFEMSSECDLLDFRDSMNRKIRQIVSKIDKS